MRKNKTRKNAFEKKMAFFLKTIGNNLYASRTARKESLKTVAKATRISSGTIRKMERGTFTTFQVAYFGSALQILRDKAIGCSISSEEN